MIGLGAVFTLFFVTLGPLKLLGPFAQQTRELDSIALRTLALRVFVVALIAVLVGGYAGTALAAKWHVSVPAIDIAAGIILFLVAIGLVMAPYEPSPAAPPPLPATPMAATLRLTFPLVVTPYGIAALIALLSSTDNAATIGGTYAMLTLVVVLNLLAMLFIRNIMRGVMLFILQIVGAVLGVLQVGLAVQFIIRGLRELHVLSA